MNAYVLFPIHPCYPSPTLISVTLACEDTETRNLLICRYWNEVARWPSDPALTPLVEVAPLIRPAGRCMMWALYITDWLNGKSSLGCPKGGSENLR